MLTPANVCGWVNTEGLESEKTKNFLLSASGTGNVIRKIFVTLSYSFIGCDKIYNENWFESFSSEIRLEFGKLRNISRTFLARSVCELFRQPTPSTQAVNAYLWTPVEAKHKVWTLNATPDPTFHCAGRSSCLFFEKRYATHHQLNWIYLKSIRICSPWL